MDPEKINFVVTASLGKGKLTAITDATAAFNKLAAASEKLNAALAQNASAVPRIFKAHASDISSRIKDLDAKGVFKAMGKAGAGSALKPEEMAKALGYDPAGLRNFMVQATNGLVGETKVQRQRLAREMRGVFDLGAGQFKNVAGVGKGIQAYTKYGATLNDPRGLLEKLLGMGAVPVAGYAPAATQSFGQRMAEAKKAKKAAAVVATAETASSPEDKKSKESFAQKIAGAKREFAADLLAAQAGEGSGKSVPEQIAAHQRVANQIRGIAAGEKNQDAAKVQKALEYADTQERKGIALAQQEANRQQDAIGQQRKKLDEAKQRGDKAEQKRLQKEIKAAEAEARNALDPQQHAATMREYNRSAKEWERQDIAEAKQRKKDKELADRMANRQRVMQSIEAFKAQGGEVFEGTRTTKKGAVLQTYKGRLLMPDGSYRMLNAEVGAEHGELKDFMRHGGSRGQKDRLQSAMEGLSIRNMAANILKVGEWAAAVGVLYKTVELARYSLKRLEDTGMEMAHLSIVFRGVGGSVAEVTNDMIKLAAA
ncbi:MAG: hypothetical protein KGL39_50130, partial [Patescibacteria group bacterium]|nr:hypothetical protein [Patescibacteria group bacterium]